MSTLDESAMEIMINLHEYNQLLAKMDRQSEDLKQKAEELKQKTQSYEVLERDYLKLFEQIKSLEKGLKNLSAISISTSLKMIGQQSNYLKRINEKDEQIMKLQTENKILQNKVIDLQAIQKKYLQDHQNWNQILWSSQPSISADNSLLRGEVTIGIGQGGTDKIQISHEQQEISLFSTQPAKKQSVKKPSKDKPFTSSQSSIYSQRIEGAIRKLINDHHAVLKKLKEYQNSNGQSMAITESKQSTISEISNLQNCTFSELESKYKKVKTMNKFMMKQLDGYKQRFKNLVSVCKGVKIKKI